MEHGLEGPANEHLVGEWERLRRLERELAHERERVRSEAAGEVAALQDALRLAAARAGERECDLEELARELSTTRARRERRSALAARLGRRRVAPSGSAPPGGANGNRRGAEEGEHPEAERHPEAPAEPERARREDAARAAASWREAALVTRTEELERAVSGLERALVEVERRESELSRREAELALLHRLVASQQRALEEKTGVRAGMPAATRPGGRTRA